ncbi:ABC transporter permease [Mesorhizobium sp. YC-39]|uniref:ABC transporter permease n=1 Tax=unclassified Mesorhizobium TaxID=325217 RepID=UPI0021E73EC3|nr:MULTISPECIES: ABC transporter permease [unclassified Mesorhizobium]MCV3210870.1 ABC transporter permease [Mesorhizobium sp. YC-2]MCV3231104.1 ABC transporter permease [Mesorhizobium sp. YC-39]
MSTPSGTKAQSVGPLSGAAIKDMLLAARLPIAIVVTLVLFGLVEPRVLSLGNFRNIAIQASYLAIFAMAQTMVILTRGFDLSLGYTVSLVSVAASMAMVAMGGGDASILYGIGIGILIAAVIGLANGLLIAGIGINPLVTTLGMANMVMALASTISGGFPVTGLPRGLTAEFAQGSLLSIPIPIWFAGLVYALLFLTLKATKFGRSLYIIGANPRAAVAAGIRTLPVLVLAYTLCAVLAALGALLLTARTGSGEPNLGGNLTLEAIAAAVVGGVRLSGGEGGVGAALLGALFITVLSNGMNLVQIDGYLQQICLGVIIIVSLIVNRDVARR